ncbi:unnamed protein product [Malus baccata var. baccata]
MTCSLNVSTVLSHSAVWCKCVDEDVGSLKGVDCNIPHRPGQWILYALYFTDFGFHRNSEVK